jgi:pimeloyl-ACP methyl ester carboxylesterase
MDWKFWQRRQATPRFASVLCTDKRGLHRMAYTEWGDPANPRVLLCVHGLTRNGRDFDDLAAALSRQFRVVCPDVVGRGRSDRLADPGGYDIPQYLGDLVTLIARLGVAEVDWVGTSMGGLIGMSLASLPQSPIRRLVLNDVGPLVAGVALARIATYLGRDENWPDIAAVERYLREIHAAFGPLSDEQWRRIAEQSAHCGEDGRWRLIYDPAIGGPFRQAFMFQDVELWSIYERIRCPVLAVRGADSDLLAREVWLEMARRGPAAQLIEMAGVGHAPMFHTAEQIVPLRDFLTD